MGKSENRNKSQATAADLVRRGIYHGKHQTQPYPNSGGLTMAKNVVGSAAHQRANLKKKGR